MRILNLLKTESPRGLCPVYALRDTIENGLERNVRQRNCRRAEHKAAEEAELDSTGHLRDRIEGFNGTNSSEESGFADSSMPAHHGERVQDGGVSDQVQYRVDAARKLLSNASRNCPGAGPGSGTSWITSCSGPPYCWMTIAFISFSLCRCVATATYQMQPRRKGFE